MHGKRKPEAPKQARSTSARKTRKQTPEAPAPSQTSDSHQQGETKFAVWPDIPPTWELEHDARGHLENPRIFGPVALAHLGDSHAFAPDCCVHRVIPSSPSWTQRRGQDTVGPLRTKELHLAWRCKLGTEAPRGEEEGKKNHQTSPSMHVKPDTPPTARHGESWNVMPAVWP